MNWSVLIKSHIEVMVFPMLKSPMNSRIERNPPAAAAYSAITTSYSSFSSVI